jgi:hypothetical protein
MKNFVTDPIVRQELNEVENALGYELALVPLADNQMPDGACAVTPNNAGKYVFICHTWFFPAQADLFHELRHVRYRIAGIPNMTFQGSVHTEEEYTFWMYFLSSIEHFEISPATHRVKLLSRQNFYEEALQDISDFVEFGLAEKTAADFHPTGLRLFLRESVLILRLAEILLFPLEPEEKQVICEKISLYPRVFRKAEEVACVFRKHAPLAPQSFSTLLEELVQVLELPPDIHRPSYG